MKKLFATIAIVTSFLTTQVLAHENHTSSLSDEEALKVGATSVGILVSKGNEIEGEALDESWAAITAENGKMAQKGPGYYVVAYTRPNSDKTLYLLLDGQGKLYDANFSGKFKVLEQGG